MTIADFCKGRNVDSQSIRKYIERHSEEFGGHIGKKGREISLDQYAISILDGKYPLPKPVEVVEDTEARRELSECRKELAAAYKQLAEQSRLIAQAETAKLLLEDREEQLQRERDQNKDLQERLEREQSKTWWDKLRGR